MLVKLASILVSLIFLFLVWRVLETILTITLNSDVREEADKIKLYILYVTGVVLLIGAWVAFPGSGEIFPDVGDEGGE